MDITIKKIYHESDRSTPLSACLTIYASDLKADVIEQLAQKLNNNQRTIIFKWLIKNPISNICIPIETEE
jgi:hypothetical protein